MKIRVPSLEVLGVPGEKLIVINRIDAVLKEGYTIVNYSIFASDAALAAGVALTSSSVDVRETPAELTSAVVSAAYSTMNALQFPTGTVEN